MHEPSNDCDGIKRLRIDPFQWEIYNERVVIYVCECVYQNISDDI